jgi:alpha-tubulin suppressor-like RCC1 family protein
MRMIAGAVALLFGLLAAGCNGEVVGGGQRPAAVLVVSGDLQTGTVGEELPQPLVVKVVDEAGRPVRDQLVNFRVTSGGGSVFAGSAITNREGIAQERWTLGTVAGDTQQVEARAVDPETGAGVVFATFRAVGTAGPAAYLERMSPVQQAGTAGVQLADSLVVRVGDQYGNAVSGATVTWTVISGGGSVSPATAVSRADGMAKVAWTLGGAVGAQTVRASLGGQAPADFMAQAGTGAAVTVEIVTPPLHFTSYYQAIPIVVTGRDAFGNPVAGAVVTLVSLDASIVQLVTEPARALSRKNGSTRIVATLQNGAADTVDAVVQQVPAGLRVMPDSSFPLVGETVALSVVGWDGNQVGIANLTASYTSNNPGVASIQGAVAHANAAGTARVTGTTSNGVQDEAVVEVFNPFSALRVEGGYQSTCAVGTDGKAYCWGSNEDGRLATGGGKIVRTPAEVGGPAFTTFAMSNFVGRGICALTAAGAAYCWGGTVPGTPATPTAVAGGLTFTKLAVGAYIACGLTTGEDVYCWGENRYGRLGTGDTVSSTSPRKIDANIPFKDVSVGVDHACAVATNGTVYCWGANYDGETGSTPGGCLGNSNYACILSPQAVPGGHDFVQVQASFRSTCALTTAGAAYCWGSNSSGQLGVSRFTYGDQNAPIAVGGGYTFTSLTAGSHHVCGLTSGGEAYCWGSNTAKQSVPASGADNVTPAPAAPGFTFTALSAGASNTCGIATGGGLYCWSSQGTGELGNGYIHSQFTFPVRVRVR